MYLPKKKKEEEEEEEEDDDDDYDDNDEDDIRKKKKKQESSSLYDKNLRQGDIFAGLRLGIYLCPVMFLHCPGPRSGSLGGGPLSQGKDFVLRHERRELLKDFSVEKVLLRFTF